MKLQDLTIAVLVAFLVTGVFALPHLDRMRGLSIDILFLFRQMMFTPSDEKLQSHTVVVAIDEETYRRAPFLDTPKTMWTPQIGRVLDNVISGGAKVVGFDVIFPTSVGKFVRGYDRPFLIALRKASRKGQIVLGKVQHQAKPIIPHRMQSFAVGHQKNIRTTNVFEDPDGIIRQVPLVLEGIVKSTGKTRPEPTLSLELVMRAVGVNKVTWKNGPVVIDGYTVPGSNNGRMTLNFSGNLNAIPTYSLADLHKCADSKHDSYFENHFKDKVVLVGVVLDVEDRKLTSKRLITGTEGSGAERCILPKLTGLYRKDLKRDSIPGVYIHATAINNMLDANALRKVPNLNGWLISILYTVIVTVVSLLLSPLLMSVLLFTTILTWSGVATYLFYGGLVIPLLDPITGAIVSFGIMLAYKFAVADRDKRFLRKSFEFYLSPSVIDQMVDGDKAPALGGETRDISILFSDIASFTSISESLEPEELVTFLNKYLTEMTNIVENRGGFVDKYIGDAIVGVFGAPLIDPKHAPNAVLAALECNSRLKEIQNEFKLPDEQLVAARIGVNSGHALVGNIGSKRRFNYTVIGDTVNLAARLEGANKAYNTDILISDNTKVMCDNKIVIREIDRIRVVGRTKPVVVFEPINLSIGDQNEKYLDLEAYAEGLEKYRAGQFKAATEIFSKLAEDGDKVARRMSDRAQTLLNNPPQDDWQGVTDLDSK